MRPELSKEQVIFTKSQIPVYSYRNKNLHSFCLCLYLRAGSMFESDENNGISHFFEHIVFKNINRKYGGELYRRLDALGLDFNGCTCREFMQFIITGAEVHFEEAVEILCSIFEPIRVPSSEIATERKRIKSEIRESDENKSLDFFTQKIIWEGTSLKNSIAGTYKNLDRMGINALREAQKTFLSPNNLFFYATGNVSQGQMDFLVSVIDSYEHPITQETRTNLAPHPAAFFNRNLTIEGKNDSFYYICFCFDVDTTSLNEAENSLFYDILFEGECSLIHQELSEKTGLVYSFSSSYDRYDNLGNLSFCYEVRSRDLYQSMEMVVEILNRMKKGLPDGLTYVLPAYVDNAMLLFDDAEDFNWIRAYECHILKEEYPAISDRVAAYKKVTPERIAEIAGRVFRTENFVLTYKAPSGKFDKERARRILEKLD